MLYTNRVEDKPCSWSCAVFALSSWCIHNPHDVHNTHTRLQKSLVFWKWSLTCCSKTTRKGLGAEAGQGVGKIPPSGPAANPISLSFTNSIPTGWPPINFRSAAALPSASLLVVLRGPVKGLLCHPSSFHGVLDSPDTPARMRAWVCVFVYAGARIRTWMLLCAWLIVCICVCVCAHTHACAMMCAYSVRFVYSLIIEQLELRIQGSSFLLVPCCTPAPESSIVPCINHRRCLLILFNLVSDSVPVKSRGASFCGYARCTSVYMIQCKPSLIRHFGFTPFPILNVINI